MDDDERAKVGTCYKQKGNQAAVELGHRLVSGAIKAQRMQAWADFVRDHPDGYLYCFRGGLRSQISQQWLTEAGIEYPRIKRSEERRVGKECVSTFRSLWSPYN